MNFIKSVNSFLGLATLNNTELVAFYSFVSFIVTTIVAVWLIQYRLQSDSPKKDSLPVIASEIASTFAAIILLFISLNNFISVIH